MKKFFIKPYRWASVFSILLIGSFIFTILDTFVIPKSFTNVVTATETNTGTETNTNTNAETDTGAETDNGTDSGTNSESETITSSDSATETNTATQTDSTSTTQSEAVITDTSYEDENIKISIETVQKYDSTIYVADIQLTDVSYLKTALAGNTYGRNIKDTTSEMAEENNAIFAINGDYYGFRDYGFVLRNGVLYRDTASDAGDDEALVIDNAGDFSIIEESQTVTDSLDDGSIWQILSFGPALVKDGQIAVDANSEVSQSMSSNPRTAIGQISELHYLVIVSDGRTNESAGLSLLELAQEFYDRGCTTAYNLDGGGSTTMYFNGNIVNNPTNGRSEGEREVSDIVYIGY